jgi:hypothetical protein
METEVISETPKAARPTFLVILCILTFIGSSYSIYSGTKEYFTADVTARMVSEAGEKASDQIADKPQPDFVKNMLNALSSMSADMLRKSAIISLISALLTLTGAILMWTLRKNGFYLYVGGWLVSIIGTVVLFGGSLIGIAAGGLSAFVAIIFIILYGVNLKYLVK